MSRRTSRRLSCISLSWLLWLAALVPLAQVAAARHELSHVTSRAAERDADQKAVHSAACGLCLAFAAVHGAGVPTAPAAVLHPPLAESLRGHAGKASAASAPTPAYRSRAPPVLAC